MNILLFFVILLLLVVVHEFGHFIAAKKAGIRVDEFAFGFPPRIFAKKWGETTYAFNWLPIGGYVKIFGEDPTQVPADHPDHNRSFIGKPRWVQAIVIVSGVFFNLLLAWVLVYAVLVIGTTTSTDQVPAGHSLTDTKLYIGGVLEGSPAEVAGFKGGDQVLKLSSPLGTVEGEDLVSGGAATAFIAKHKDTDLSITVMRDDATQDIAVRPRESINARATATPAIGVYLDTYGTLRYGFLEAIPESVVTTWRYTKLTAVGLAGFFGGILKGEGDFTQVAGPVGIVKVVGDAADHGISMLLLLTALISINLAVINMIPFPALDGGRFLFIVIESIIRRPISAVFQQRVNIGGFALLLLLMFVVTYFDFVKLF